MAGEATTIARPYAEAVFAQARERDALDHWSEVLALLAQLTSDSTIKSLIADPTFGKEQLSDLLIEIAGDNLDEQGRNLVRLLVQNGRLGVTSEISELYEQLKTESQKELKAIVRSAYALKPAQEKLIADALSERLGKKVSISSEKDPSLIGGVHIRAGDLVIDGSVSGRLQQLANELGI